MHEIKLTAYLWTPEKAYLWGEHVHEIKVTAYLWTPEKAYLWGEHVHEIKVTAYTSGLQGTLTFGVSMCMR